MKPLVWVETNVEPVGSRIEYMVKAKSQFKSRSIANNVEIFIPVPSDVDSPSFKASIGTVTYIPDKDCIMWSIKQFYGSREYPDESALWFTINNRSKTRIGRSRSRLILKSHTLQFREYKGVI